MTRRRFCQSAAVGAGALPQVQAAPLAAPRARSVIFLFMAGGPPQHDLFDYSPGASRFAFRRHGGSGAPVSELLPHLARQVDRMTIIRSMQTTEFNHAPAQLLLNTGSAEPGTPSLGARIAPGFPVLVSGAHAPEGGRSCWSGGVELGRSPAAARFLDWPAPGWDNGAFDARTEPRATRSLYGDGLFAEHCLLARRMVERGARFVQLCHCGWDTHGNAAALARLCAETDQATAALLIDLRRRGLLDSTLVVWGGEFGRAPFTGEHAPQRFTVWMAGGGADAGVTISEAPVTIAALHARILRLAGVLPL